MSDGITEVHPGQSHGAGVIQGFLSRREVDLLAFHAARVPHNGTIVEIGSYLGKSTDTLAKHSKGTVTVYAVDTWDNRAMGALPARDTFAEFSFNVRSHGKRIVPIRAESKDAGKEFKGTIDLLFIDGDHSEAAVFSDLFVWVPLLKQGGTLLMHDYTEKGAGVRPAFERYSPTYMKGMIRNRLVVASMLVVGV